MINFLLFALGYAKNSSQDEDSFVKVISMTCLLFRNPSYCIFRDVVRTQDEYVCADVYHVPVYSFICKSF